MGFMKVRGLYNLFTIRYGIPVSIIWTISFWNICLFAIDTIFNGIVWEIIKQEKGFPVSEFIVIEKSPSELLPIINIFPLNKILINKFLFYETC